MPLADARLGRLELWLAGGGQSDRKYSMLAETGGARRMIQENWNKLLTTGVITNGTVRPGTPGGQ